MKSGSRQALGQRGEDLAEAWLEERGFRVLARNARVGRLELDVVARRGDVVVFCEVRSRRSDRLLSPVQTIDSAKVQRIRRAAAGWLTAHPQGRVQMRFDAASVVFDRPGGRLTYYEAAF